MGELMLLIIVLLVLALMSDFLVCMYAVLITDSEVQEWEEWNLDDKEDDEGDE